MFHRVSRVSGSLQVTQFCNECPALSKYAALRHHLTIHYVMQSLVMPLCTWLSINDFYVDMFLCVFRCIQTCYVCNESFFRCLFLKKKQGGVEVEWFAQLSLSNKVLGPFPALTFLWEVLWFPPTVQNNPIQINLYSRSACYKCSLFLGDLQKPRGGPPNKQQWQGKTIAFNRKKPCAGPGWSGLTFLGMASLLG